MPEGYASIGHLADESHAGHGCSHDPLKSGPYQDGEPLAKIARSAIADDTAVVAPRTAEEMAEEARRLRVQANELGRQANLARQREIAASRPQEPAIGGIGDRAIVSFVKYQGGREYNYAAIGWRVGNSVRWAVTGQTTDRLNWPGLLQFIGAANWGSLHSMTEDQLLGPLPGSEPPVREVMGSFGRVQRSDVARFEDDYSRSDSYPDF